MADELMRGRIYTRSAIRSLVGGGDLQTYLPQVGGRIVAGCFNPRMNLRAPTEIDVGEGPRVVKGARLLVAARETIPVFLKRSVNEWEFVGYFRATGYSEDPADLLQPNRRPDAVAVFFLEEVADTNTSEDALLETATSIEGHRALVAHFKRERSPELVRAKRRLFKALHGHLECEACGLQAHGALGEAGEACFEAHHLALLSAAPGPVITRLEDLAILCANCHRIIHRFDPLPSLSEFRVIISSAA